MTSPNLGRTIQICVVCINAFFIGGLCFTYQVDRQRDDCSVRYTARYLFWCLFPFRFIIDLIRSVAAFSAGYYGAIAATNVIPGVFANLATIWYATVPCYYLELLHLGKHRFANMFLLVTIAYLVSTMLSGGRAMQTICIISLFVIILSCKEKIGLATYIKYGAFALVGMIFIDVVFSMRESSIDSFMSDMGKYVVSTERSNIVLETVGTFGETIYTPFLVIAGYGKSLHPFFGECFLKSLVGVIPDVFGTFHEINNDAIFAKRLGTESQIGGSFAGEMYYNFGSLYAVASAIIGCFFGVLSLRVSDCLKKKRFSSATMEIIVGVLFLWWVRDTVGNFTRQVVWALAMLWMFGGFRHITMVRDNIESDE